MEPTIGINSILNLTDSSLKKFIETPLNVSYSLLINIKYIIYVCSLRFFKSALFYFYPTDINKIKSQNKNNIMKQKTEHALHFSYSTTW
jgi:hypothetical protein